MKRFILCGDSWAWGYEVLPPHRSSEDSTELSRDIHYDDECKEYRLQNRYGNLVSNYFNMQLVDLSMCGASNTTIVRTLIDYLVLNGYFDSNTEKDDLLISIGWTNPARIELWNVENNNYERCNNIYQAKKHVKEKNILGSLFTQYFEHSCHPNAYLNEWTQEVFKMYSLLKSYNIKFIMHQAFYHIDFLKDGTQVLPVENNGISSIAAAWRDKLFWNDYESGLSTESKMLWDIIDEKYFILKNSHNVSTMNEYIIKNEPDRNKGLGLTHPNALGHRIWADYMIYHINKHFVL